MFSQKNCPMTYHPISCSFYDELEAIATLGKSVVIVFIGDKGGSMDIQDRIKNLETRNGEEFMTTASGQEIRLDRLISVDGKFLSRYC